MKIQYTVDMEDLAAFNRDCLKNNPYIRRRKIILVAAFALLFLVIGLVEIGLGENPEGILVFEGVGTLFLLLFWFFAGRVKTKTLANMYKQDANAGVLCRHELELTTAGLVERTDVGEHRVLFQGIERVESTPTHSYLFIGTMQAHVIPHAKITEGNLAAFLEELKRRMGAVPPDSASTL